MSQRQQPSKLSSLGSILEALRETVPSLSGSGKSTAALRGPDHVAHRRGERKGVVAEKTPAQFPSPCHLGMRWRVTSSGAFEIGLNCPSMGEDVTLEGAVVVRHRGSQTASPREEDGFLHGHTVHQVGLLTSGLVGAQH